MREDGNPGSSGSSFTPSDWRVIAVCGLVLFLNTAPQGFMFNVINPVMEELHISRMVFGSVVGLSTLIGGVISACTGGLIARIGSRGTMLAGCVCVVPFSLLLSGAHSLLGLMAAGCFLGGAVALGTVGVAAAVLRENLGARMGAVFGVLSGIAFMSQALVSVIMGRTIPLFGYRPVVLALGMGIALLGGLLTLLLPARRQTGAASPTNDSGAAAGATEATGLTLAEARKTASFWLFGIATFFSAMLFSGLALYTTDFFIQNGMSYPEATSLYTILTVSSAVATALSGIAARKAGPLRFLATMLIGFFVGITLLAFGFPATNSVVIAFAGIVLCSIVRPINIAPGLLVGNLFGPRDYASINTFMLFFFMSGGGIASIVLGGLADILNGNYTVAFASMSALAIASLAMFAISIKLSPLRKR